MKTPNKTTLITVLGSSPQVMTETLYALKDKNFPQRIIVFTTLHGANEIRRLEVMNKINELCQDYDLAIPTLHEKDIKIVKDLHGNQLNDIRNNSDQEAMADQITQTVRELVKDDSTAIHASIAGGRKSMSFYMGYIFSIFARPCDTLSHVLVAPEFESGNFWYPTKDSSIFIAKKNRETGEEFKLDAKDADVELAEIPFLRINKTLAEQGDMLTQNATYRETLEAHQLSLSPENISLSFTKDHEVFLNKQKLDLSIEALLFYRIVARSCLTTPNITNENMAEDSDLLETPFLAELAQMASVRPKDSSPYEDKIDDIEIGMLKNTHYKISPKFFKSIKDNYFTPTVTERLKKEISEALKKVAIGQSISFCEVTVVKAELSEDTSAAKARQRTKGGYLGLQLNPKQIHFS